MNDRRLSAVLFDLDGTLIDTAPDMVRVLAEMLEDHGAEPLPYETVRSWVSNGSLGLINLGFPDVDDQSRPELQAEYLQRYADSLCEASRLFPGVEHLLDTLEREARPWGIVTNKPTDLTLGLLDALNLRNRADAIVCGDTLPQRKPDPAPLLHAASEAGIVPAETIYVGDDLRDIDAGRAAGMLTIAAAWGYIVDNDSATLWQADMVADDGDHLADIVSQLLDLSAT